MSYYRLLWVMVGLQLAIKGHNTLQNVTISYGGLHCNSLQQVMVGYSRIKTGCGVLWLFTTGYGRLNGGLPVGTVSYKKLCWVPTGYVGLQ